MAAYVERQHSSRVGITQTIAYTATSAPATNAFAAQTFQIRVVANSACHYKIGDGAQTATTADPFLPANQVEYVTVTQGQRIAAIAAATGGLVTATNGTLWCTELC